MRLIALTLVILLPIQSTASDLNPHGTLNRMFNGANSRTISYTAPLSILPPAGKGKNKSKTRQTAKLSHPAPPPFSGGLATLSWIGNLSWGFPNTVLGLLTGIGLSAACLFTGRLPSFHLSSTRAQIIWDTGNVTQGRNVSLGLFHIGTFLDHHSSATDANGRERLQRHESGHAIQSAVLGPFYLHLVLTSYAINGFKHGGFMEDWAHTTGGADKIP